MRLRQLTLNHFRCYHRLELAFPDEPVVLVGRNAQGKTSLLEAIYLLATSRAPHGVPDRQLIHWDAEREEVWPFSQVLGHVERREGPLTIEIVNAIQAGQPGADGPRLAKRIRVNEVARRAMDLVGLFNVVLFTPHDLEVVSGAPAERRRYLDGLLCQVDPAYCRALSRYNQVLAQRNHLLRLIRERRGAASELAFWDERLVQDGSLVLARRLEAIAQLGELAVDLHERMAGGGGPLRLSYHISWDDPAALVDGASPKAAPTARDTALVAIEDLAADFTAALERSRAVQLARGITPVGPHRDDLSFQVNGADMRSFGSRGQQRSVALALRLAEARLMQRRRGDWPVVLLDDVLSELDPGRRARLLGLLAEVEQTMLTTADLAVLPADWLRDAAVFEVEAGRVGLHVASGS